MKIPTYKEELKEATKKELVNRVIITIKNLLNLESFSTLIILIMGSYGLLFSKFYSNNLSIIFSIIFSLLILFEIKFLQTYNVEDGDYNC